MRITVCHPDDPDGTSYELAPIEIADAIGRRFDSRREVVLHPTEANVFIYDPMNWWDGPTHVKYEPEFGLFSFDGWGGPQRFPLIGPIN